MLRPKLVGHSFLDLNLIRSPALKPPKARQAVNFGIDREEIAGLIYGGGPRRPPAYSLRELGL